ncbi:ATP-binding cassette domain-containing protein [Aeromonas caviae]|uniref:ATP-binding cassette domain-containing protein n=1 Tax=Aeromonas caviae TaxID=648 RepID=UPI0030144587
MSCAISLEGLTKRFGERVALNAISAAIPAGGITGLVGPDGAGKSTLLRLLAGLLIPEAGTIRVLGLDPVSEGDLLRQHLGYMPQQFGLYEDLSVLENLTLYADLRGVLEPERTPTFARLLAFTDLARFTARPAGKLSGGMKQKLGLACALLGTPDVLLLDEPGVGVDPISRRALWQMVRELAKGGMTVLWSTAYLDEAELCDHVLLMADGEVRTSGTPADLMGAMASRCWLLEAGQLDGRERRALLHEPPLLFLDEPTSGVDPVTRREFWSHINALADHGVTVLVTTHFMDEAEYCDRIALIYRGKLLALGTPDDLKGLAAKEAATSLPTGSLPTCSLPTMEEAFITLVERASEEDA